MAENKADQLKEVRPWGWFIILACTEHFKVKQISVAISGKLSLQSHKYREEHWVIVSGSGKATVNDETRVLNKAESIKVPYNAIHSLENIGNIPLVIIETQIGSYFGEDDITRYADIYGRS